MKQLYKKNINHRAVLKWVLQNDFIASAVPGYSNYKQMEEDFSVAYNLEYTDEERKFLNDRNVKAAMKSICQQCSRCVPSCPNQREGMRPE
jgi:predicted aldo/keto reductase-like oxidoreductase